MNPTLVLAPPTTAIVVGHPTVGSFLAAHSIDDLADPSDLFGIRLLAKLATLDGLPMNRAEVRAQARHRKQLRRRLTGRRTPRYVQHRGRTTRNLITEAFG